MTTTQTSVLNASVAQRLNLPNVAVIGRMGAGKSTAAELLAEYGYSRRSFANELREVAVSLWGEDARNDRDKLQKLGVFAREIDENTWANKLFDSIDFVNAAKHPVVIDDCRFPNEYWGLKERGFVFIRVVTDEATRIDRLMTIGKLTDLSQLEHESEAHVDGFECDHTMYNDGDRSRFAEAIHEIVKYQLSRQL